MLITPSAAQSDPITSASQEIAELESKLGNLVYKDETAAYIEMAKEDFLDAKTAQENLETSITNYNQAVIEEGQAESMIESYQSQVDGQTAVVDLSFQHKNDAQNALDQANINLQTASIYMQNAGNQGWQFIGYALNRVGNVAVAGQQLCSGVLTQAYQGMPICGRHENIYVIYSGKITAPPGVMQISFAGYTDDGFRMYADGNLVINQWIEQGATWSQFYYHNFTQQDRVVDVVFHYYNGGGPGVFHVGWGHSGMWTGVSPNAMSYGQGATQEQIDDYNEALEAQENAQEEYDDKLSVYNQELQTLNLYTNNLNNAISNHLNKVDLLSIALLNKENSNTDYSEKLRVMNETIQKAWDSYNKQFEFEERQRIAAAIANAIKPMPQPEPTPETSVTPEPEPTTKPEPTPEPNPEPTPTEQPSQEPEPTTKPEPEPTIEPTPEPTPSKEPDTIVSEPTPEPTPVQTERPKPIESPVEEKPVVSQNLANIIADLTSANTLTKLTEEQKQAVSKTLGISTEEIAIVAELAKSDPAVAQALEEFAERAQENSNAPMPYTLADAITETQAEEFLSNPISAITDINVGELLSNFSELGSDMTDDQREKAQEVIIPVVIVSQIASAMIAMRR